MVFNRFWRADPARARTSGGTGLGLSISLEDTHLHGGWLQAWGRPGEGAQFRLTLPRRAGDAAAAEPAARWCPTTPGSRSMSTASLPRRRARSRGLRPRWPACVRMPDDGPVVEVEPQVATAATTRRASPSTRVRRRPGESPTEIVARLPRGDDGDPDPHQRGPPVPLRATPQDAWEPGGADHHLRRAAATPSGDLGRPAPADRRQPRTTRAAPGSGTAAGARARGCGLTSRRTASGASTSCPTR